MIKTNPQYYTSTTESSFYGLETKGIEVSFRWVGEGAYGVVSTTPGLHLQRADSLFKLYLLYFQKHIWNDKNNDKEMKKAKSGENKDQQHKTK